MCEVGALPREIMMMKECATSLERVVEDIACANVEWEGCQVFDHHEVGVAEGSTHLVGRRWHSCADRETGKNDVGTALTGDGGDVVAKRQQRVDPLLGFDGDTIGATESETNHRDASHQLRLGTQMSTIERL